MSDAPTASEILSDLDDDSDDECIYLDRDPDDAYLWAGDDQYYLLERSRSGSWFPRPKPVGEDAATYELEQTLESDTDDYEVRPQTELPPDRHHLDR